MRSDSNSLLIYCLINHFEKLVSKVQKYQWRALNQLNADHEAILSAYKSTNVELVVHLVSHLMTILLNSSTTSLNTFWLVWLLENLDVEAQKLAYQVDLDHLLIIEEGLLVKLDSAFQLAIFLLWNLPIL